MARIVILGAGLGGVGCAYEMKEKARREDEVIVINDIDFYQFVPSNPWVIVGWRTRKKVTIDLKAPMKKKGIEFIVDAATKLDPDSKTIHCQSGRKVEYDFLIIATGPTLNYDAIEGLGPKNNTHSVCHIDHAEEGYIAFEEFCKNPGPLIVGAVQGASCYGPAYETAMIIDTELKRRKIRDKVKMTFVTAEPYIGHLGLDGVGNTKGMLEAEMRDRHIGWVTNAKVTKIDKDKMYVDEMETTKKVKQKHELDFAYSMMLPPFKGIDALQGLDGLVNPAGFVFVDKNQRNEKYPEIYGIGVCIAIPPMGNSLVPVGVPKTGYMIESMAHAATDNIAAILRGGEATAEATWNAICLADFGDSGVMFVAQPQIPPRNVNWAAEGKWVHTAKVAFEKLFLKRLAKGKPTSAFEKVSSSLLKIHKLK
ncbi:MAG: pyridine nucleotide-disulfide oxidoreductase [Robiginitomaculum sp.]|nr:MAG: pyridine nucleotide-disulfide oxidoreductase [Robiginitomaculum sp.]